MQELALDFGVPGKKRLRYEDLGRAARPPAVSNSIPEPPTGLPTICYHILSEGGLIGRKVRRSAENAGVRDSKNFGGLSTYGHVRATRENQGAVTACCKGYGQLCKFLGLL